MRFIGPTLGGECDDVVKRASTLGVELPVFDEPGATSSVPWAPTATPYFFIFSRGSVGPKMFSTSSMIFERGRASLLSCSPLMLQTIV